MCITSSYEPVDKDVFICDSAECEWVVGDDAGEEGELGAHVGLYMPRCGEGPRERDVVPAGSVAPQ